MNYAALQLEVSNAIIDTPPNTLAAIPSFVKQAVKDLQDRHGFKVSETVTAIMTTTLHTRVLAQIPTNLARYRKKPTLLEPISGRALEIDLTHSRDAAEREFGTAVAGSVANEVIAGRPRVLLAAESNDAGVANWEVYPLPDGLSLFPDGEYRIRVPYYRYLPVLVNGSDTNWFTENAEQFIIQQSAAYGFFHDHDENRGTLWTQRAVAEFNKVVMTDKMLRLSSVNTLRVSPNARGPRVGYGDN